MAKEKQRFLHIKGKATLTGINVTHASEQDVTSLAMMFECDVSAEQAAFMFSGDNDPKAIKEFFWSGNGLRWYGINSVKIDKVFDTGCYFIGFGLPEAESKMNSISLSPGNTAGIFNGKFRITIMEPSQKLLYQAAENLKAEQNFEFDQRQLSAADMEQQEISD